MNSDKLALQNSCTGSPHWCTFNTCRFGEGEKCPIRLWKFWNERVGVGQSLENTQGGKFLPMEEILPELWERSWSQKNPLRGSFSRFIDMCPTAGGRNEAGGGEQTTCSVYVDKSQSSIK